MAPWPWANNLISDSLDFLICILGIKRSPSWVVKSGHIFKALIAHLVRTQQQIVLFLWKVIRYLARPLFWGFGPDVSMPNEATQRKTSEHSRWNEKKKVDSEGQNKAPRKLDLGGQDGWKGEMRLGMNGHKVNKKAGRSKCFCPDSLGVSQVTNSLNQFCEKLIKC